MSIRPWGMLGHLTSVAALVAVGLVWRMAPLGLPPFWLKYGGSVLWGAMVLMIVGALRRTQGRLWRTPALAAVVVVASELFRLIHTPALDAFRLTLPGALLLGRVFNPWNIVAYLVGVAAAVPLHAALSHRGISRPGH